MSYTYRIRNESIVDLIGWFSTHFDRDIAYYSKSGKTGYGYDGKKVYQIRESYWTTKTCVRFFREDHFSWFMLSR